MDEFIKRVELAYEYGLDVVDITGLKGIGEEVKLVILEDGDKAVTLTIAQMRGGKGVNTVVSSKKDGLSVFTEVTEVVYEDDSCTGDPGSYLSFWNTPPKGMETTFGDIAPVVLSIYTMASTKSILD